MELHVKKCYGFEASDSNRPAFACLEMAQFDMQPLSRYNVAELVVESYQNSTVNTILKDIGKKYKVDPAEYLLNEDSPVDEIKFKYRTYSECVKMLYRKVGVAQQIVQVLTFINLIWPIVQFGLLLE